MNTESNIVPTASILDDIACISRAFADIKKAKATYKKYLRAKKLGKVTDEQVASAKAVLTESIADSLERAFEAGLGIGQGAISDYRIRAEANASEILS